MPNKRKGLISSVLSNFLSKPKASEASLQALKPLPKRTGMVGPKESGFRKAQRVRMLAEMKATGKSKRGSEPESRVMKARAKAENTKPKRRHVKT